MGERYSAEIRIGGKVPVRLLEGFLGELNSAGARVGDCDGEPFDADDADELRQALNADGHLYLADAEASYGRFEDLEGFLCASGIPFDRHSDAHFEFDAENVRFRPGMERPVETYSNNRSDDLVDMGKVRPVARELARLAEADLTRDELLAAVAGLSTNLTDALPPEIEPLPLLEIVE